MANVSKIQAQLTLDNKDFKNKLRDSNKGVKQFSANLLKIAGTLAAAFSVKVIGDFAIKMTDLSVSVKNVERAFDRLDGVDLQTLRRATGGMISDMELMKKSIQASNLGLDVQQLATYFEFATIRAAETGESVEYLVNSIVTGIGRKSVMIMDNLGISATALRDKMKEVGDFGKAAAILINEELGKTNTKIEDTIQGTQSLAASWQNFMLALSQSELFNTFNENLMMLSDALNRYNEAQKKTNDEQQRSAEDIQNEIDKNNKAIDEYKKKKAEVLALGYSLSETYEVSKMLVEDITDENLRGLAISYEAINALEDTNKELTTELGLIKKINKEKLKDPDLRDTSSISILDALTLPSNKTPTPQQDLDFDIDTGQFDVIPEKIEAITERTQFAGQTLIEEVEKISIGLGNVVGQIAGMLGNMLTDIFRGGEAQMDALTNFLAGLGELMIQYGSMLIAFAVGEASLSLGPVAAAAAGIALIGIGAALASTKKDIGNYSSAGSYSGGGGYQGSYNPQGNYDYNREITLVARGNDLVGVLNKTTNRYNNNG